MGGRSGFRGGWLCVVLSVPVRLRTACNRAPCRRDRVAAAYTAWRVTGAVRCVGWCMVAVLVLLCPADVWLVGWWWVGVVGWLAGWLVGWLALWLVVWLVVVAGANGWAVFSFFVVVFVFLWWFRCRVCGGLLCFGVFWLWLVGVSGDGMCALVLLDGLFLFVFLTGFRVGHLVYDWGHGCGWC